MSDKIKSDTADFEKDLEFGKLGEDFFVKILRQNFVKFDDLRDDDAARAMDADFRIHFPVIGPVLVDVKTHTSWDKFSIELYSNKARGVKGCDYNSHSKYFVHVFPITQTVLVVDRERFINYVESTETWKKIPTHTFKSIHDGDIWESEYKDWNLSGIPGYSEGKTKCDYPFDWWVRFDFDMTDELFKTFWTSEKFRTAAWNYENTVKSSFKFNVGDVIRCPFCLDKGRPGNMVVKNNGLHGGVFFSCPTCFEEYKRDKKVPASFDLDGWKRNKLHQQTKYMAKYPLFILRLLGKSDDIGIVE